MISFPKPSKPSTNAFRVSPKIIAGSVEYRDPVFPGDNFDRTYSGDSVTGYGSRSYASGTRVNGFRLPTGYSIAGRTYSFPPGQSIWKGLTRPAVWKTIGTAGYNSDYFPNLYSSRFFLLNGYASSMPTNIFNRLNTELLNKIGNRSASYGEALAESRKTVNHLAKTASSLAKAVLAARKGNWSAVAKALGVRRKSLRDGTSVSERWLEYQFGWLPLMGDIYDTHKVLTKGLAKRDTIMSSSRTLGDSNSYSSGDTTLSGLEFTESVSYRAKAFYKISDSWISNLNNLGLINPIEVAWALVPFSFVVDWFLPVGNFLQGITDRCGVQFVGGFYGTRATLKAVWKPWPEPGSLYNMELILNSRIVESEQFAYTRNAMTSLPLPGLYFKNPLSTSHALSALALIRQLTK